MAEAFNGCLTVREAGSSRSREQHIACVLRVHFLVHTQPTSLVMPTHDGKGEGALGASLTRGLTHSRRPQPHGRTTPKSPPLIASLWELRLNMHFGGTPSTYTQSTVLFFCKLYINFDE